MVECLHLTFLLDTPMEKYLEQKTPPNTFYILGALIATLSLLRLNTASDRQTLSMEGGLKQTDTAALSEACRSATLSTTDATRTAWE